MMDGKLIQKTKKSVFLLNVSLFYVIVMKVFVKAVNQEVEEIWMMRRSVIRVPLLIVPNVQKITGIVKIVRTALRQMVTIVPCVNLQLVSRLKNNGKRKMVLLQEYYILREYWLAMILLISRVGVINVLKDMKLKKKQDYV